MQDADVFLSSDAIEMSERSLSIVMDEDFLEEDSEGGVLRDAGDMSLSCSSNPDLSCEESFTPFETDNGMLLAYPTPPAVGFGAGVGLEVLEALQDVQTLFRWQIFLKYSAMRCNACHSKVALQILIVLE